MDFNPSDLQRMLLDSAERFLAGHYTLEHRRSLRATPDGLDEKAWESFAELGWLAILPPEELGGLEGSMTDVAVLCAALGARCVADPFTSTAVIGATLLCGGDAPDAALIEELIGGTARIALAHDEPDDRYDYTSARQTTLTPSGDGFRLTGQKLLALDAPSATHFVVTAQGPDGLALAVVGAGDGITQAAYALHDGSRAADLAIDVEVPASAIIAQGDAAQALLALALDRGRVALAAQSVGSIEAELTICSAYLKEREQFGQPIGKFQALQHIMADMFVEAHQARSILYYALSQIDGDPAARARAVAMAKLRIGEAAQLVSRQAIQLHGGYGVTDEYEVSHHYRRQLMIEKQYGDLDYAASQCAA